MWRSAHRWSYAAPLIAAVAACGGQDVAEDEMPIGSAESAESLEGYFVDGPAVASPAPHRYDVYVAFWGSLYHRRFVDGRWNDWSYIGSGVSSKPAVVSWGPGRVDLVARGPDNSVLHWWGDGDSFEGPESLGGSTLYAPTIASRGDHQLQVFAVGADHQLWSRGYGSAGWSGWTPLGGWINASPSAVSMDADSTDVFVRGGDSALYRRWQRGSSWYGYEWLGGALSSGPAAASFNPGRLEVYARDSAGGLSARTWSGIGWDVWKPVPVDGGVTSDPAAVRAEGEICDHVFFRQTDGSVGHRGCGDTTVATFGGGGTLSSIQGSFETTVFSGNALDPYFPVTQQTLEGMWPRELVLLDTFDDETCTGAFCGFPAVVLGPPARRYSTLPAWQHVSSGFDLSADFGPFKANRGTSFPVRQARLVDHGACSIKTRWTKSVYDAPEQGWYPDPEGVGALGGFFVDVYLGLDGEIHGSDAAATVTRNAFFMEPTFLTPPGSTDLRARDDGFALTFNYGIHTATDWYLPDSDVVVSGAANYAVELDAQGLLALRVVGPVAGYVDKDLTATLAPIFGHSVKNSSDVVASLAVDLPKAVHAGFIDELTTTGLCDASASPAAGADACLAASAVPMKMALRDAMIALGSPPAFADSTADDLVAHLLPANFACVPGETEGGPGVCKYHPIFKRVNVLPDGFELVIGESDDVSDNDVRILAFTRPDVYAACANTYAKPPVDDRHLYRLDGDVWMMK